MMKLEYAEFVIHEAQPTGEFLKVRRVARKLFDAINESASIGRIASLNKPGANSKAIQEEIEVHARELGFQSEKRGLFKDNVSGLRPDFYLDIGTTGVLLEVERGKTTTNNMHMLDFWKCHVCEHANYLFLFVPSTLSHSEHSRPKQEFATVTRHLELFFREPNYTNVRGLFVFGYP